MYNRKPAMNKTYTPEPYIEALVPRVKELYRRRGKKGFSILEPAAGDGRILKIFHNEIFKVEEHRPLMVAIEKDWERYPEYVFPIVFQDFLEWKFSGLFDLIITSPPWTQFDGFVERARKLLKKDGNLYLLMKSEVFHSAYRCSWLFEDWMPKYILAPNMRKHFISMNPTKMFSKVGIRGGIFWLVWENNMNGFQGMGHSVFQTLDVSNGNYHRQKTMA